MSIREDRENVRENSTKNFLEKDEEAKPNRKINQTLNRLKTADSNSYHEKLWFWRLSIGILDFKIFYAKGQKRQPAQIS